MNLASPPCVHNHTLEQEAWEGREGEGLVQAKASERKVGDNLLMYAQCNQFILQ